MRNRILVIACGALAREILALQRRYGWSHLHLKCLDPRLHNRPERIAGELRSAIEKHKDCFDRIFVGYADCGTSGAIDSVIEPYGIERLPGAHCYEFLAGQQRFDRLASADPGTFFLTDFLARNFQRLVIEPLRLDEFPDHIGIYFAHYSRVVYVSQAPTDELLAAAQRAADRLGLDFGHMHVGYGEMESSLKSLISGRTDVEDDLHILA